MNEPSPIRILIADPDEASRQLCVSVAGGMGLVCSEAQQAVDAFERLELDAPELLLVDPRIADMSGQGLLAEVKRRLPSAEIALVCAGTAWDDVAEAMRSGAYDVVSKPICPERVKLLLERMVEKVRLVRENESLRLRLSHCSQPDSGASACTDLDELERLTVRRVFEQVGGDKEQAQRLLGISRATLYRKIKRYGIPARQLEALGSRDAQPSRAGDTLVSKLKCQLETVD